MNKTLTKTDLMHISKDNNISQHEVLTLLSYVLEKPYSRLFFEKEFIFNDVQLGIFYSYIQRRSKHEPIAKIVGSKEFYGISFKTNRYTLDPRPDTELIIDTVRSIFKNREEFFEVLDLCCGTGCIGLTLLSLYSNCSCDFVDISREALDIAIQNSKTLGLEKRARFVGSDLFENIRLQYDLIVSNPPYVSRSYVLDEETAYDPELALFANNNGMEFHEKILSAAHEFLKPKGLLILEIGFDQSAGIRDIKTNLKFVNFQKDLQGINRVCVFQNV